MSISGRLRRLAVDRRAVAIPTAAIMFALLLAFSGLVLDGGLIYFEKRRMQFAADAGSYSGAQELLRGNQALIDSAAKNDTRLNGYKHGEDDVDVQVNYPPTSGSHQDNNHVEVIISRPVPTYFMKVLNFGDVTVRARAVSGFAPDDSPVCVLALSPTADPGLVINGGASLQTNCTIQANSGSARGMRVNGGSNEPYCMSGDYIGVSGPNGPEEPGGGFSGNEDCMNVPPTEGSMPVWDPYYPTTYDPVTQTTDISIEEQAQNATAAYKLNPATTHGELVVSSGDDYCGPNAIYPGYYAGIRMTGGCLEFRGGFYALDGLNVNGGLVKGGPEVNTLGTGGVTIFNTAEGSPASMRGINISANAEVHLTATKAVDNWCCEDFLFINSRNAGTQNQYDGFVCGNAVSTFEGRLYFPTVGLTTCGTAQSDAYIELIADTITVSGTADISMGGLPNGRGGNFKIALVE